ncbi:MAG TPA: OsmC family protein [Micromonospora sp.]
MPIRTASAEWRGNLTDGSGSIRTGKGGLQGSYSFRSRFEEGEGTNPEELVAAAHAGCFSMALSKGLSDAGFTPVSVNTTVELHLEKTDAGMTITRIDLNTVADVPEIEDARFQEIARNAKDNCPISRLLAPAAQITLSARLAR